MKAKIPLWPFFTVLVIAIGGCSSTVDELRTFYRVPLICNADKEIGCGSRVKPFFLETQQHPEIRESWINRQGTVIAIVWNEGLTASEKEHLIQPLFKKHEIPAEYISDEMTKKRVTDSFFSNVAPTQKGKDKWYKGVEVDHLSFEEARVVSDSATVFAVKAGLINEEESAKIRKEIEDYMKTELVKVRTYKELCSDETDLKWKKYGYEIYIKHVGTQRAEKIRDYYITYQKKVLAGDSLQAGSY